MGDDAETGVVESAESVEAAASTELAGVAEADTMSAFAWSDDEPDDYPDEPTPLRPFLITSAAVCLSLSLVGVTAVLGYRWATDEVPAPAALSAPMTTTAVPAPQAAPAVPPPPPVTVTTVVVQSTIQAPAAVPASDALDNQFVSAMRAQGWQIVDRALMVQTAHRVCAKFRDHTPMASIKQWLINESPGMDPRSAMVAADQFAYTVIETYPNCERA